MEDYKRNIKVSQRIEYGIYQILDHVFKRRRVAKLLGKRRKVFYKNLYETVKESGKGRVLQIERRKDLSEKEFKKQYQRKGIPVILEGAAKDWDCVKKWSFEYIKELHGKDEVVLFPDQNSTYEVKSLGEILGTISSGGKEYLRTYPLLNRHPEHIADFDTAWLRQHQIKPAWYSAFGVFMGSKDMGSKLHSENKSNLFTQIYGEKKWVFCHPYYTPIMDPLPIKGLYRTPNKSVPEHGVDLFYDEQYASLAFQYIDRYEGVTKPGDVLWIPPLYWHTVKNPTNSIGASYQWFNPFLAFRMAPLYMLLDALQIHPPIWKSLKRSAEDANMIIMTKTGKLEKYLGEKKEPSLNSKVTS